MTERDEPYTPSVDEAQMFYEAGRSAMRRASTGEQIIGIGPFTAEFDRMIEAVRAEERERWKATAESADALLRAVMAELDIRPDEDDPVLAVRGIVAGIRNDERETPADEPIAKRLTHMYMGDCPDEVNGWESRDPECPACRALVEVVPDDRA